jgi:dCMP deaminase
MSCDNTDGPCSCGAWHKPGDGTLGYIQPAFNTWDIRFLELSDHIALWSKDPSTKCGAVIVRPDRSVVSVGYNGFPRGMSDAPELYADREVKYDRVIHAEVNAMMSAHQSVKGCTLYTNAPCCSRCAVHMIQAGITKFVFWSPLPGQRERWGTDKSIGYMREAGAIVIEVSRGPAVLPVAQETQPG